MRIVALLNEDPRSCDGGSRIRDFHLARALSSLGELEVFAFKADTVAGPLDRRLNARLHQVTRGSAADGLIATLRGKMHHEGVFDFGLFGDRLTRAITDADVVYGSMLYAAHFLSERLSQTPPAARPALIWDTHNVDADVWGILRREAPIPTRAYYAVQERRAGAQMACTAEAADLIVACTSRDAAALRRSHPSRNGRVITVENGADMAAWSPPSSNSQSSAGEVVCFGGWARSTNALALRGFLRDVWPEVLRRRSDLRLRVVGRSPDAGTRAVVAAAENVDSDYDVEDVRPYAWASSAIVIPHLHSPGSKLKAYEALATERPVLGYPETARSLPPRLGREILVAESPHEWASLLTDPPAVDPVARRQALEGTDWSHLGAAMTTAISDLINMRRPRPQK